MANFKFGDSRTIQSTITQHNENNNKIPRELGSMSVSNVKSEQVSTVNDDVVVDQKEQEKAWSDIPYPPQWELQTQRLIIRPYHINDAQALAAAANDSKIAAHMTNRFPSPYTLEAAISWINVVSSQLRSIQTASNTKPEILHFAICLRETDDGRNVEHEGGIIIGGIGADIQHDVFRRTAELGYWLSREHWGRGYMSEAVRELVEWLFELDDGLTGVEGERLLRINANVFGGNDRSDKVLRQVGFELEGQLKDAVWKDGVARNLVLFGLTRTLWDKRKAFRSVQG